MKIKFLYRNSRNQKFHTVKGKLHIIYMKISNARNLVFKIIIMKNSNNNNVVRVKRRAVIMEEMKNLKSLI